VFLKALVTDNQQKHHKHIWDKDGSIRQIEHDQPCLFSKEKNIESKLSKQPDYQKLMVKNTL
jgi:hypothetical protein